MSQQEGTKDKVSSSVGPTTGQLHRLNEDI